MTALGAIALTLAGCGNSSTSKYGVSASPRMVEPGQPVPKGGGAYRVGKPYTIAGQVYTPEENRSYQAEGLASWYGEDFHGRLTANREIYDMNSISAAHPTLPMPSYVRITNLKNRRSIVARVNDRGPYHPGRVIDVSIRTAKLLGFYESGTTRVRVEYVGQASLEGSDDAKLEATLRHGDGPRRTEFARNTDPRYRGEGVRDTDRYANPRYTVLPAEERRGSAVTRNEPRPPSRTVEATATFDSRFAPAQGMTVAPSRNAPVSAYAPPAQSQNVMTGRGLY